MVLLFLLSIIMFFFCLYFYFEQKKLKQRISELEEETKTILERKILTSKSDIISIDKLSIEEKEQPKKENITEPPRPIIQKENISNSMSHEKYKAKPIYSYEIPNNYKINNKVETNNISTSIFNPEDFISNRIYNNPTKTNHNPSTDYLKELSNKLNEEVTPKTIELTDYEKDQEEHAIISYQELLSLKNNINVIDDEKETI